ncbi:MAG: RagB/SusD family nutrient uptake outer membrane protein [Bacteroidales bacterium]|nr:RagB/SusD family nutrient uptake outer membrane protein [Bacteroidales bacterium]
MKKIYIPILLVLAFAAVSCEKLLDIPQKGTLSTLEFYASDADAEAAINNVYASFISNVASSEGIDVPEQVIINYAADDVLAAGGHANDHPDFRVFCEFRYDEMNGILRGAYDRYVSVIYACNLVISNFTTENRNEEAPKWESDLTKQYVAEARVMRAYIHMMMALLWYQPGILDRLLDPDELPVQAESQSQVLEWVIAECEKAISSGYLPVRKGTGDKNATARMSLGFAQFVAGKAAVFNNDMATARKYLGDLIASGNYALVAPEDFWTNFHVAGDGNSEKIFEPNFIYDNTANGWDNMFRSRWMVADVFCWRTEALASMPSVCPAAGWNGGAIEVKFAEKFLAHDGDSPRRKATFITEDEFLYKIDWKDSKVNDGTLAQKKADPARGIGATTGIFGHGPYFEWKNMSFAEAPKFLTGGKSYPKDNITEVGGGASNATNYKVARYAEVLLLYAEACIGSGDEAKGLKALQDVQNRSGSGKVSSSLTLDAVMEEKQYELWFESCRFFDLVRWAKQGKVNLDQVFNGDLHKRCPTVFDEYADGKGEHKLYTTYTNLNDEHNCTFVTGKHEYLPFPADRRAANKFKNVLGWTSLNDADEPAGE